MLLFADNMHNPVRLMIKLVLGITTSVLAYLSLLIPSARADSLPDATGRPDLVVEVLQRRPDHQGPALWRKAVKIDSAALHENFKVRLSEDLQAGELYFANRSDRSTYDSLVGGVQYTTELSKGALFDAANTKAGSYILASARSNQDSFGLYGIFSTLDGKEYLIHGSSLETATFQREDLLSQVPCGVDRSLQRGTRINSSSHAFAHMEDYAVGHQTGRGGTVVPFDVAVMITPQLEADWGGYAAVLAMIHVVVEQANNAYTNSAVLLKMNLAGIHKLSTNGSGDIYALLDHLSNSSDGEWDEVPAVRDQMGADVVALLYHTISGPCGVAQIMATPDHSSENRAFSVTQANCISGNTFAHEIAHNMGAQHSIEDGGQGIFPDSHGFKHYSGPNQVEYATIMSYPPGFRIPHFSNPAIYFEGDTDFPTGLTNQADNARTLNITGPIVAAYRQKTVINVPAQFMSIQSAINAAPEGAEIRVAPGTYSQALNMTNKSVRLVSTNGPQATVLHSLGGAAVMRFVNSAGSLEGFSVSGNTGIASAVQCMGGSPLIKGNIIRDNILQSGSTTNGAGVSLINCSGALINNLLINNASALGKGGAVSIESGASALLQNNIIVENSARVSQWYLGGGPGGGGIYIGAGTSPKLVNNTISNNRAPGGGGIYVDLGASPSIQNTILSGNYAPPGDDQDFSVHASALPTLVYSLLGTPWPGFGNIVGKPIFEGQNGSSYELNSSSPGIDQASGELAPLSDALGRSGYDDPGADNAFYAYDYGNHEPRDIGALEKQTPSLAPQPATGKLRNGDFRIDQGWDYYPDKSSDDNVAQNDFPDGWEPKIDSPGVLVYESPAYGGRALHLHAEEGLNFVFQDVPVQYGKVYEVSGTLKVLCDSPECFSTILSECLDANHQLISGSENCGLNTKRLDIQRITSGRIWVDFQVTADNYYGRYLRVYCAINPPIDTPPQSGTGDLDCTQFAVKEIGEVSVSPTPTPQPGHPGKEHGEQSGEGMP